jgi:hypothetical protein
MKNTANNPHPQSELIPPVASVKPIATHATCAQFQSSFPSLAPLIDDTFLRNRAREGVIPKPIRNQYPVLETLAGLAAWFAARGAAPATFPEYYDSMQALADSPLRIPKEFTRWALENGAGAARLGGSRIATAPILARAGEVLAKITSGNFKGIEGLEQWDKDTELAKKLRLESAKLEDEKAIRQRELIRIEDVEEFLWEKRDQPLRAALVLLPRNIERQQRKILERAGVADEVIEISVTVVRQDCDAMLKKLRTKLPARQTETNEGE